GDCGWRAGCWVLGGRRRRQEILGMPRGRGPRVAEFSGTSRGRLRRGGPIHRREEGGRWRGRGTRPPSWPRCPEAVGGTTAPCCWVRLPPGVVGFPGPPPRRL